MSIKILGGVARGLSLATPHESITRPTSVLLKRRLFDYFQDLSGFHFIDLCAGSGSMGLEALSRGAESIVLVEKNFKAFQVIKKNLKLFENKIGKSSVRCLKKDFLTYLKNEYFAIQGQEQSSTILYFDPPYENIKLYEQFFDCLKENNYQGLAIIEACKQKTMGQEQFVEKFGQPHRNYQQGTSFLFLYDYNKE